MEYVKKNTLLREYQIASFSHVITAFIAILPVVYIIWNRYNKKPDETLNEYIERKRNNEITVGIISFVFFIGLTIYFLFYKKPSDIEISHYILVDHLNKKNILDNDVYKTIMTYKPPRLSKYGVDNPFK